MNTASRITDSDAQSVRWPFVAAFVVAVLFALGMAL